MINKKSQGKKNKYSEANRKRWANPEYKRKVSISISKALQGNTNSLGLIMSEEAKEKIRNSEYHKNRKGTGKGELNFNWKGDIVKYGSLHTWINNNFDKPDFCELCKSKNHKLEWSNKDHKYSRNRINWQWICRSCHRRWDNAYNK